MPSRINDVIAGNSSKVSRSLAKDIHKYGMNNFVLITVQEFDIGIITKTTLVRYEQLWMLLYPTYNMSLFASSNDGSPMSESTRINMSNTIYQYELVEGIFSLNVKIIYGLKELVRLGVINLRGTHFTIQYDVLKGCIDSGLLWKNTFLFTLSEQSHERLLKYLIAPEDKTKGVWVYKYGTLDLIIFEPSVKICLSKYSISSTHFKRIRKFKQEYNGMLFSNNKLH